MAMVVSEEKKIRTLIIDPMNLAEAENCKTLGHQAAVKLFLDSLVDTLAKCSAFSLDSDLRC